MQDQSIFKCNHIYKSFDATKAVVDVSLSVFPGEIRGLIGENGSGKSTLSSIVAGVLPYDEGEMVLKGEPYHPAGMISAQKMGVSMIVQEIGTIPNITVAANIFVGKENLFTNGLLSIRKMNTAAKDVLEKIGAGHINPSEQITNLSLEDRKLVEIARAIYDEPDLFIVDETTTALSHNGREIIYSIARDFAARGKAVLFISHDLDEVMTVCNSVTILRDGELVMTMSKEQMNVHDMRINMVCREISDHYYRTDYDGTYSDDVVLNVTNVTNGLLENFSFKLHKGEILGFGGLSECGMHQLGRAVFGADKVLTGTVELSNGTLIKNTRVATKNGMAYVSKNRDFEGLVMLDTIKNNITLPSLRELTKYGYISAKSERKLADSQIDSMKIKCSNGEQLVMSLSGGNKQKVVFAKWMAKSSEMFILDCPTRGVDIGVKAAMYRLIEDLKRKGKSIIIISEELSELIGMCDRIIVLKDGKFSKEFTRNADLKETEIIHYMI
jgi:ribose transport system ATP-binding protein